MEKLISHTACIFLLLMMACTEKVEVTEETYADGKPKRVVTYEVEGGKKNRVREIQYYPAGHKKIEGEYEENKRHGTWKAWHENGALWSVGKYDNGIRNGEATVYHSNEQVHIKGNYRNDSPYGKWQWYDEGGQLVNEIDYSEE